MKLSQYFIPTIKEIPSDAVIASHQLMIRAGLIRKVSSGLYIYLPYGLELLHSIEKIIRQEMNKAGALECKIPLLIPQKLLLTSNRWNIFKNELFRLKSHNQDNYALSPTNEENFTQLALEEISSYKSLPIILYQINYKFRDEIRPRYGVMRGKEFLMKDAYSFDLNEESLNQSYLKMKQAYINTFTRMGLDFVCVQADSGAMGGNESEEFMVKSEVGEETIVFCENCDYVANLETAQEIPQTQSTESKNHEYSKVHTPNTTTIKKVCKYLKKDIKKSVKSRIYTYLNQMGNQNQKKMVLILIRGDYEINEVKLKKILNSDEVKLASNQEIEKKLNTKVGFIGGIGINQEVDILVDHTVVKEKNLVMGANEKDYHFKNVDIKRDIKHFQEVDVYLVKADQNSYCIKCQKNKLKNLKGIEIGHIFKLGPKYIKDFKFTIINQNGMKVHPTMGCYGIGVTRCLATIIEQNYDTQGIILPLNIAPFKVIIINLDLKNKALIDFSQKLYQELQEKNFSPLLDDRDERPGFKFKDANLLGVPIQIIIGKKNFENQKVELIERKTLKKKLISLNNLNSELKKLIQN